MINPHEDPCDLAVLVLAFRRPQELSKSLNALKMAGVRRVYVNVDGPREGNSNDVEKIKEVIDVLRESSQTLTIVPRMNQKNGGVGLGLTQAISWFFDNEESGLVIEDDIVIEPTSLNLALTMLTQYSAEERVGSVTLFNSAPQRRITEPADTWRFSAYPSSWYWGTWRNRWNQLESSLENWTLHLGHSGLAAIGGSRFAEFWGHEFDRELAVGVVPWEALWLYTHWKNDWLSANTNQNFCINLGYSQEATNSFERPTWYPVQSKCWLGGIQAPMNICRDMHADEWVANQMFGLSHIKALKRALATLFPWAKKLWRQIFLKPLATDKHDGFL